MKGTLAMKRQPLRPALLLAAVASLALPILAEARPPQRHEPPRRPPACRPQPTKPPPRPPQHYRPPPPPCYFRPPPPVV
ncbi:MAG TPA: hypothetical protein PLJ22_07795, partial [Kiritimatiellia bacterium]|nr:hypothetical protein [Kiritimatiellia bacterium]